MLGGYTYDIKCKTSEDNANADFLSRLPVPTDQNDENQQSSRDEFTTAKLFLGRELRTRLSALKPNLANSIQKKPGKETKQKGRRQ